MRTACCRVSDLPLAAELRASPELAGLPLAVTSGSRPRAELLAVSPEAAQRGVRRLDTVAHARAVCADMWPGIPILEASAKIVWIPDKRGECPNCGHISRSRRYG